jgi:hypothetical protein
LPWAASSATWWKWEQNNTKVVASAGPLPSARAVPQGMGVAMASPPAGEPTERFPEAAVAEAEGRPLIHVPQAAAGEHQDQHLRPTAQGHQGHQPEAEQQAGVGGGGHPVAPAGEIDHGMGLAVGVHTGVGVEDVIGQVLPGQQQHRPQQEQEQLVEPHGKALAQAPAGRQQHGHHRHRVHRPFDGRPPQPGAVAARRGGVTACDDLVLGHGGRRRGVGEGPYI